MRDTEKSNKRLSHLRANALKGNLSKSRLALSRDFQALEHAQDIQKARPDLTINAIVLRVLYVWQKADNLKSRPRPAPRTLKRAFARMVRDSFLNKPEKECAKRKRGHFG